MTRLPPWIRSRLPATKNYGKVRSCLSGLHTICEEACCPNRGECWDAGTATFLIMGDTCTRDCRYCSVKHGTPTTVDHEEPERLAQAVKRLGLRHAVITSVTRDDLPDGGASIFAECVARIREAMPGCSIELLIPDFGFSNPALRCIVESRPEVVNHNIEVVESLFPTIRPQGNYRKSLGLMKNVKEQNPVQKTKSGMMIGLGESDQDIKKTLEDLKEAGVDMITIGQYLRPSGKNVEVVRYYTPDEFSGYKKYAESLGFTHVESAPLVRSSYHAGMCLKE